MSHNTENLRGKGRAERKDEISDRWMYLVARDERRRVLCTTIDDVNFNSTTNFFLAIAMVPIECQKGQGIWGTKQHTA